MTYCSTRSELDLRLSSLKTPQSQRFWFRLDRRPGDCETCNKDAKSLASRFKRCRKGAVYSRLDKVTQTTQFMHDLGIGPRWVQVLWGQPSHNSISIGTVISQLRPWDVRRCGSSSKRDEREERVVASSTEVQKRARVVSLASEDRKRTGHWIWRDLYIK